MTGKVKLAIGAGVLLLAGVAYARSRKPKMDCSRLGPEWSFVPANEQSEAYVNGSEAFRARIKKYGGYCAAPGQVSWTNGTTDTGASGLEPSVNPNPDDKDAGDYVPGWTTVDVPTDLGVL